VRIELEKKLFEKYPKILAGKDKPITESLIPFGFECGDGWFWLIGNLCDTIQKYCDSRNCGVRIRNKAAHQKAEALEKTPPEGFREIKVVEEDEWQVEATQVKEKFGGLRFYINGGDDEVYGMISFAEHLSYHICEQCGSTENVKVRSPRGWISTLCDRCYAKREKKN